MGLRPLPRRAAVAFAVALVAASAGSAGSASAASGDVTTVLGDGSTTFVDGAPATGTGIGAVTGLAGNELAGLYAASAELHRVVQLDSASDVANLVAGTGTAGFAGDGGPARSARLSGPTGLAYDRANAALFVADTGNQRVRRILLGGTRTIATVAGTGTAGSAGDGGPATAAQLSSPQGLALGSDGTLYVADTGNHRVRAISAAGTITTVAGTGTAGSTGDGGAATAATLDQPVAVLADAAGTLWIADRAGAVVRAVASGTITRRAGTGTACQVPNGDGGPATAASLCAPSALAARSNGDLAVGEASTGRRVRAVSGAVPYPPSAVTGLTVTGGVGSITVTWGAPADTGGMPVVDYRVQVLLGGSSASQTVTATSATFGGLSAGLSYNVSVWPRNAAGEGAEAQAVGSPTSDPPVATTAPPATTTTTAAPPATTAAPVPGGTADADPSGTGSAGSGSTGAATGSVVGGTDEGHSATVGMAAPTGADTGSVAVAAVVAVLAGAALVGLVVRRRRAAAVPPEPWI